MPAQLASPSNFQAVESPPGTVTLSWGANPVSLSNFEIEYRELASDPWMLLVVTPAVEAFQSSASYVDVAGLAQTRRYRVRAIGAGRTPSDWSPSVLVNTTSVLNVQLSLTTYATSGCDSISIRDETGDGYDEDSFPVNIFVAHYELYDVQDNLVTKATFPVITNPQYWREITWSQFDNGKPPEGVYMIRYYVMWGDVEIGRAETYLVFGCELEGRMLDLATKLVKVQTACCDHEPKQNFGFLVSAYEMGLVAALKEKSHDKAQRIFTHIQRQLHCLC